MGRQAAKLGNRGRVALNQRNRPALTLASRADHRYLGRLLGVQMKVRATAILGWVGAGMAMLGCDVGTGGAFMSPIPHGLEPSAIAAQVAQASGIIRTPHERDAKESVKPWTSSHAMVASGGYIFIADSDRNAVVVMRQGPLQVVQTLPVANSPQKAIVGPDGTVYVAPRHGNKVLAFAPSGDPEKPLKETPKALEVGLEPRAMALSAAGDRLYVVLGGARQLVTVDVASGQVKASQALNATPTTVTAGGSFLIVTYDTGTAERFKLQANVAAPQHEQSVTSAAGDSLVSKCKDSTRRPRRTLGAAWEPSGDQVLAARAVAAPGTVDDISTANMAEIDPNAKSGQSGGYGGGGKTKCNDGPRRPMEPSIVAMTNATALPAGEVSGTPYRTAPTAVAMVAQFDQLADVAIHPTRRLAAIPATGTDNVLLVHSGVKVANGDAVEAAVLKTGQAPTAIAFSDDGRFAFTLDTHSVAVSRFDLGPWLKGLAADTKVDAPIELKPTYAVAYGQDVLPEAARIGRRMFTFAGNSGLAKDGIFACASCHADGGEDKLVWMVSDGPRQTPALAGRLNGMAPFNWKGTEGELQNNMVKTIHRMGGTGLSAAELASLEQFLLVGLPKVAPNPNVAADGQLTAKQLHGKELFERADVACAGCHLAGNGADGKSHDVGTASTGDKIAASFQNAPAQSAGRFDTPSLRNLWNTAPYFHDGTAATLIDVLSRPKMGGASKLSVADRADLVEYLKTL